MSKKGMTSVWSWDHAFNAMAMAHVGKKEAFEQFMAPFMLQAGNGVLPDRWNPAQGVFYDFTKPPVHGWVFLKLMETLDFDHDELATVYNCLKKQTEWWLAFRDPDGDGLPAYPHGNDSGWDNSTVFDNGYYITTPDLSAFLVLQMHALSRIADKIGIDGGADMWKASAQALLDKLIALCWKNDHFVALRQKDHETGIYDYRSDPSSLLVYIPLVLGELLDKDKTRLLAANLEKYYLTEHGLATEKPSSPRYESDGYWRGPIWAPPTYIIVDGLRRAGETALAETIARRYIRLSWNTAKGNYENFDALTGKGLRAPGYTWSASVYMLLKWEYR
jgi:glycogen debranching enzyme